MNISSFIISNFHLPVKNKTLIPGNDCVSCQLSKSHKLPFRTSSFNAFYLLYFLYADVWGPAPVVSVDGSKYFLLIVDLFTQYYWVYPLNAKSQVAEIFPSFQTLVEKQFDHPIQNLYSDNGGEFVALRRYLTQSGISWLTTAPHTP